MSIALSTVWCAVNSIDAQVVEKVDLANAIKGPLLDEEPFDLIFLDEYNREAILKIVPLKETPRKPFPTQKMLIFEFHEDLDNLFQVPWQRVVEYKSYRDLVAEEGDRFLEVKDYPKAFRNYLYVYDNGGKEDPNIVKSLRRILFEDGVANFKDGKFELALSIFEDIYRQDKNFKVPGLPRTLLQIIMACYEGIARGYLEEGEYESIRALLTQVSKSYEEKANSLLARWTKEFERKSDELLQQAKTYADDGNGIAAHESVRNANSIFPGRKVTLGVYSQVVAKFPLVFVGVTQGPDDGDANRLENWGARRIGKLTQRTMIEFAGLTDEGGRYEFLNGQISQIDDLGLQYRLEIDPSKNAFAVPPVTAYQVSERLQSYADPSSPNYKPAWAKVVDSISVESETQILFKMRIPFVRPEALLQFPYYDDVEDEQPLQNGAYIMTASEKDTQTYELNPSYQRVEGRQHPTIIEKSFRGASEAADALIKGDIDVIDRISPVDIPRLKKDRNIAIQAYTVPTVHMLIPNQRNEFVQDKNFRSGLLRGINRELILNEMILDGQELNGCETVSGPFPRGTVDNDQLAYGYNLRVQVSPYNQRLGMVLVQLVNSSIEAKMRAAGEKNPVVERPPIVLVHPADDVAVIACRTIARQWMELGVKTLVVELPKGKTQPQNDDWDFLYVSASIQEPLVEVDRLLGDNGFAKTVTAPTQQSLRQLSYSRNWQKSSGILRQIHRQVANDMTILPLWQLTEYYAYRRNVRDIGRDAVHLYENIERWRIFPIDDEQLDQQNAKK